MSVARCREINARLRAAGITVREWPGWESRGNGLTSAYEGCIVHHTASRYGPTYAALVTGRADLAGPLCNYGGNEDGSVTIVAAHPANHAGASGGRSMGPLPTTRLFNPRTMGLEIVYPGTSPMRPAQYRTACIWVRIVTDVLGYGDIQRARAHAETSVTGKFDPGYAPNRTINMAQFRSDARASLTNRQEDDVNEAQNNALRELWQTVVSGEKRNAQLNKDLGFVRDQVLTAVQALGGQLSGAEAAIVAATRQIVADDPDAEVELTDEDVDRFAARVLEQVPTNVRDAVREAFARAAQPDQPIT